MNYSITPQVSHARHIARSAEQQIKSRTGMKVNLVICPEYHGYKNPEQLLMVIAASLNMDITDYKTKCRLKQFVDLRFIGAHLLCQYFPGITLQQITVFFGGQHHTSILNGLDRVKRLIAAGDPRFMSKYEAVLVAVNRWIRREVVNQARALGAVA